VKVPRKNKGSPRKRPLRLIGYKGYDSDPLRKRLKEYKIDCKCSQALLVKLRPKSSSSQVVVL
jgi:hypothetical protein